VDDEDVGDFGKRKERGIEEGDEKEAGRAKDKCERAYSANDSAHGINLDYTEAPVRWRTTAHGRRGDRVGLQPGRADRRR
ncbi:MAG: hypothetical protein DMF98_22125, partial [Acidobacteria bacterium]